MERIVQLLLVSLVVFHVMMQTGYSLMDLLFQLVQVQQQLQLPGLNQLIAITLHRGDNSFSPTGQYCCVIPPDATYNAIVTYNEILYAKTLLLFLTSLYVELNEICKNTSIVYNKLVCKLNEICKNTSIVYNKLVCKLNEICKNTSIVYNKLVCGT